MQGQTMDSKWTTGGGVVRVVDHRKAPVKESVAGGSDRVTDNREVVGIVKSNNFAPLGWTGRGWWFRIPIEWKDWWSKDAHPFLYHHEQRFYAWLCGFFKDEDD